MALKDVWTPMVDGVDEIIAEDINNIASSVIELEENGGGGGSVIDAYTKEEADNKFATKEDIGNISSALDELHAYAQGLVGGEE